MPARGETSPVTSRARCLLGQSEGDFSGSFSEKEEKSPPLGRALFTFSFFLFFFSCSSSLFPPLPAAASAPAPSRGCTLLQCLHKGHPRGPSAGRAAREAQSSVLPAFFLFLRIWVSCCSALIQSTLTTNQGPPPPLLRAHIARAPLRSHRREREESAAFRLARVGEEGRAGAPFLSGCAEGFDVHHSNASILPAAARRFLSFCAQNIKPKSAR